MKYVLILLAIVCVTSCSSKTSKGECEKLEEDLEFLYPSYYSFDSRVVSGKCMISISYGSGGEWVKELASEEDALKKIESFTINNKTSK